MIDKTYRCNLCRDQRPLNHLTGLFWQPTGEHTSAGRPIEGYVQVPPMDVENHLCLGCVVNIQAFKVFPSQLQGFHEPAEGRGSEGGE